MRGDRHFIYYLRVLIDTLGGVRHDHRMPQVVYHFNLILQLELFGLVKVRGVTDIGQLVRMLKVLAFVSHCYFATQLVFVCLPTSVINEVLTHFLGD